MTDTIALIAAAIGGLMGFLGLVNPEWSKNLVRLQPSPEKPGGYAEFRASYGGLFLLTHLAVIVSFLAGNGFMGATFAVAMLWIGLAIGRTLSMALDDTRTGYNVFGTGFELALGVMLLMPFLAHLGAGG